MKENFNYDKHPVIRMDTPEKCAKGWKEIGDSLQSKLSGAERFVIVVECYPGISTEDIAQVIRDTLHPKVLVLSEASFRRPEELKNQFSACLTDDPVFAFMQPWTMDDYFDGDLLQQQRVCIEQSRGLIVVLGAGAIRIAPEPNLLIHAGAARWELQQRQRRQEIGNLGFSNQWATASELYKIAFFIDWPVADRLRHEIYEKIDFFLDMNDVAEPRMISGAALRNAVARAVRQPFRVVPFFDPGPWGGQWMRKHFYLPEGPANYAWCFDCVPEENSVVFAFNRCHFELPAIVLVHEQPELLLGSTVYQRFGAEFPIRFDFLDTVDGGNLSLQVHPLTEYIEKHFGMPYTQDESYYILDCEKGAQLYLGLRESIDKEQMAVELREAQTGRKPFPAEDFVNVWSTKKHDHFSIPAGTIHCSGVGNLVLEISATPYIFTFKLWDWDRLGLNGKPRPIHLEHGLANIQWQRTTTWVQRELINQVEIVSRRVGVIEERTGLHASEFLETRRHWFTEPVTHDTEGNLNVLNLVEGAAIIVSSPTAAFAPMEVHYAETFIVPASVGKYTIEPAHKAATPMATIKAYVRS